MKLLALDTATDACSAAVWVDGVVHERYELAPRRHAALILPMIEAVLAEVGLRPAQLDAVAFGRGRGFYRGADRGRHRAGYRFRRRSAGGAGVHAGGAGAGRGTGNRLRPLGGGAGRLA